MSIDRNKATAYEFFARFSESDIPGAMATMTDDATWWIPGKPELSPAAGLYQKDRITKLFHSMVKRLKTGLKMTPKGMVAEGDRVAVEVVSEGDLTNGRLYRQEYHMLLEFRDGKISAVREYLDTQHAHAIWMAPE
ncbi:MAG: nuclear transport factor 2 family protein [Acidobacteria bacterium]|nr:nuclear transport factor 2 family protein [Acidobacteriota bacterium]